MKKILSLAVALALCLCLCSAVFAAGDHTVTIINGMDGSVAETFTVADGEDLVFTISCSAPCDMGPIAAGEAGAGVTTTDGTITYSNVTLGGPHQYPTAETVTIAGIKSDATVTVTPNPDEVGSVFPAITEGAAAGGASGEASGNPSGEASSDEPYPQFEEYKAYLLETLLKDPFWQGQEEMLKADLDAAQTPDDENIQHFTGSGAVDQAPAGVVFPMTYDAWYAVNGGSGEPSGDPSGEPSGEAGAPAAGSYTADEAGWKQYLKDYVSAVPAAQEHLDEFFAAIDAGEFYTMPGDMLFQDTFWGYSAATLDEFVAAGGNVEIPAFDPNLTAD